MVTRFKVKHGAIHFYAVGSASLVKKAAESTFIRLDLVANWDKRGVLIHYPGGWLDRAGSAYIRFSSRYNSDYYGTDAITIGHHETNNPNVSLLATAVYLKVGWLNKKKQEERMTKFYESLQYEFRKLEIPLVANEEWWTLVASHPELRCSPVWRTSEKGILEPAPISS